MTRSVEPWVGRDDDAVPPPRVRARVFLAKDGRCHKCHRKIQPGETWTLEHLIAIVNGGRNAEDNLDVTCDWCLPAKNAADAAIKKKSASVRAKHLGLKPKTGFSTNRSGKWKRKMDGTVVRR